MDNNLKKYSIIVVFFDEKQNYTCTYESVNNDFDISSVMSDYQLMFFDAAGAGETFAGICRQDGWDYIDAGDVLFNSVSEVKNMAVSKAAYDNIIMINAGEMANCEIINSLTGFSYDDNEHIQLTKDNLCDKQFGYLIEKDAESISAITFNRNSYKSVGRFNDNIYCAEDYELILRMYYYGFKAQFICTEKYEITQDVFRTYAYVLGRYSAYLRQKDLFDNLFMKRLFESEVVGVKEYYIAMSESMIALGDEYKEIEGKTLPVFVMADKNLCYGTLFTFVKDFANALNECGCCAIVKSTEEKKYMDGIYLFKRKYRAIIGFQTYITDSGGRSSFGCPVFEYIFDHPLHICSLFVSPIDDFYVLSQDLNYALYAQKHFRYIKNVWELPPGGKESDYVDKKVKEANKKYEVSFVGTYIDYRQCLKDAENMQSKEAEIMADFFEYMKNNSELTAEKAFDDICNMHEMNTLSNNETLVKLHRIRGAVNAVSAYYREKVVKTLVENGVKVDVFSDTWRKCPFADNNNLIIHDQVSYDDGIKVIAESLMTLNVMSWHKSGMTERVANAMLNGAVCVTDRTDYIKSNFTDGKDIIMFSLKEIDKLPDKILSYLNERNHDTLKIISQNAYKISKKSCTWKTRAAEFISILDSVNA